jgi:hypothetical protein
MTITIQGTYEGYDFRATVEHTEGGAWEASIEVRDDYRDYWRYEGEATLTGVPTHDTVGEAAYALLADKYDRVMEERASR